MMEPSSDSYVKAALEGDECLKQAGSWVDLLIAMRYFWEDKNGFHVGGLFDPVMRDLAPHEDMLHLARSVAQVGIGARSTLTAQEYSYGSFLFVWLIGK